MNEIAEFHQPEGAVIRHPIRLAAGEYTFDFEPWSGWVRNVRFRGVPVLHAFYATTRDQNWGTPVATVSDVKVEPVAQGWRITWRAEYGHFTLTGEFFGLATGLKYQISGIANSEFKTRRTGLCVLHPMRQAGLPLTVNGDVKSTLPVFVQPDSPAYDIKSLKIEDKDVEVRVDFSGEVFEMEDQRNWSDVSFKTYCRPQKWPQPYTIASGEKLVHSAAVTCQPRTPASLKPLAHAMPEVGLLGVDHPEPWHVHRVEALKLDFVQVKSGSTTWEGPLQVTIGSGEPKPSGAKRVIVESFQPSQAHAMADGYIVVPGDFVGLNRDRPKFHDWKGLGFSPNNQVHSTDERSTLENTSGIAEQIRAAKAMSGGNHVVVGPLRFADPRLATSLGAAWLASAIIACAREGCDAVTLLPTHGEHGLLSTMEHPNDRERVVAWAPRGGAKLYDVEGLPENVRAIAFDAHGKTRVLIVNTSSDTQSIQFAIPFSVIDKTSQVGETTTNHVTIAQTGIALLELGS